MSTTAFIRALSPAVHALSGVTLASGGLDTDTHDAASRHARHSALQGASSLEELIAMVPSDYRDVLRPFILDVAGLATKRVAVMETFAKWKAHQSASPKTYPSFILTKAPSVQLTKEFAGTDVGRSSMSALERKHGEYCDALLADALKAKESERELLDGLIDPQAMWTRVKAPLDARVEVILASRRTLKVVSVVGGEPGEVEYAGWEVSSVAVRQSFEIREDAVAFAFRAISIVEGRHIAQRSKTDRKKEIAKSADVEMADASKPGPSIQSMVDRAVSARFKKALPTRSNNTKKAENGGVSNAIELNAAMRALDRPAPAVRKLTPFQKRKSDRNAKASQKRDLRGAEAREKRRSQVVKDNKRRDKPAGKTRKPRDKHHDLMK
ncbi:hypothetical protein CPB84DRAFT_1859394 [Gymnopilus junonius]|uniref:Uncharacterized protein n=1 Tax=Gymnopilus junonius TaxID=109634 RepID=A0A9P5TFE2_GYMJU|nr:hypothetical protein CPB84DRAFT_1859394 [Gymnopilus junonius]